MKRSTYFLLSAALLVTACGRNAAPEVKKPNPKVPGKTAQVGLYEIRFQNNLSGQSNVTLNKLTEPQGVKGLAISEVTDSLPLQKISVNTFTLESDKKRYINAIFKLTNNTNKDLTMPAFLPVTLKNLDQASSNRETIGNTPFRSINYYDGSDASAAVDRLHLSTPVIFDASSNEVKPDSSLPTFKEIDTTNLNLSAPTGTAVNVFGTSGWQPNIPTVLKSGDSMLFGFASQLDMAANPKDDPFDFSILAALTQQDNEAPKITIDDYDNATDTLTGTATDDVSLASVTVYDGDRKLGQATVENGKWSIKWLPDTNSKNIRAVATDTAQQSTEASIALKMIDASTETNFNRQVNAISLPQTSGQSTLYTVDGSAVTSAAQVYTHPLIYLKPPKATLSYIPTNPQDTDKNAEYKWVKPLEEPQTMNIIRYRGFQANQPIGNEEVRTYGQSLDSSLPVISLQTEPANFFNDQKGIYVPGNVYKNDPTWGWMWGTGNYFQTGEDWERPAALTFYSAAGERVASQLVGVRIHGSGSAALPQKSLRIYASKDYDKVNPTLSKDVLPSANVSSFKRLIIHSSGQDGQWTKIQDCTLQELTKALDLDTQACKPYNVYIDGEYWGVQMLRERIDEYYISAHYNINKDNVIIIDGKTQTVDVGKTEDFASYKDMIAFFQNNDMTDEANYTKAGQLLDLDNFINYIITETAIANFDWPQNNFKPWRSRTVGTSKATGDGRWRWLLYDTDGSFYYTTDTIERLRNGDYPDVHDLTTIFASLSKNPVFRQKFVDRYKIVVQQIAGNNFEKVMNSYKDQIAVSMPMHIKRWSMPKSEKTWQQIIDSRLYFMRYRADQVKPFLDKYLATP